MEARKVEAFRLGLIVLLGLAVLTAIEYVASIRGFGIMLLFIIGLLKAGLIVQYYMHIAKLWSEEESH